MKRKIIRIDRERCNGCGACAKACHEGAIEQHPNTWAVPDRKVCRSSVRQHPEPAPPLPTQHRCPRSGTGRYKSNWHLSAHPILTAQSF